MNRLLMIALEFAPVQTTGAFRSNDFARHLPASGIVPMVLSIDPEHGSRIFNAPRNEALLEGLSDVAIRRLVPDRIARPESRIGQYLRLLTSLDDGFNRRFRASLDEQLGLLPSGAVDAVYVSAPPFGAAQLGIDAARKLGVPLILDMRDAWSEWGMAPYTTYLHYRAALSLERMAFQNASAVITVTQALRDTFIRTHPYVPEKKFYVVPNGFDGPMFESLPKRAVPAGLTLNICYVGTFYYQPGAWKRGLHPTRWLQYRHGSEDWSYRSPLYFFRAWKHLLRVAPAEGALIRFHHMGATPDWLPAMADDHGLLHLCKFHGMLKKQELSAALSAMDWMLATSMKRPVEGDYCLASKTFDYLVSGKPILALVTQGSQRDFLADAECAVICDPDAQEACTEALQRILSGRASVGLNASFVNKYHRKHAAGKLAEIVKSLTTVKQPTLTQ